MSDRLATVAASIRQLCAVGGVLAAVAACVPAPEEVSPAEIPDLEARLTSDPSNGPLLLRYAAALFAADQCDSAVAVAARGTAIAPANAVGPLVVGRCLEQAGDHDGAIARYSAFAAAYPDARGVSAVRARELLARRSRATAVAQAALAREEEFTAESADPQAVAVLPLAVAGDSSYAPLGRGLAQMLISDLALLQQFRLVERLQVGALMDELALAQTDRVDPATAARMGRLVRAGRMVQGLASIPPRGEVRLEASVVQADGEVSAAEASTGPFRDLLALEKQLVIGLAGRLGYQLSQAERRRILENGTQNLTAFLAYSRGLLAEDVGDFSTAALHFSTAVRTDPGFQEARSAHQAAVAAPVVQGASAGQVTTLSAQRVQRPDVGITGETVANAVASAVGDVAALQAELATESAQENTATQKTTQQSNVTSTANPGETTTGEGTTTTVTGTIRIVFRLP